MIRQDLLIVRHHLRVMDLDVFDSRLDIIRGEAKQAYNPIVAPALL
jgi:hypothetical protein